MGVIHKFEKRAFLKDHSGCRPHWEAARIEQAQGQGRSQSSQGTGHYCLVRSEPNGNLEKDTVQIGLDSVQIKTEKVSKMTSLGEKNGKET